LEAPSKDDNHNGVRVFSWGCGNYGVLGHNRQKDEYFPRHIAFLPRGMMITKLAAGSSCSLVLTSQGHVYYWGKLRNNNEAVMKPQVVDALANNQHVVTHFGAGSGMVVCTTTLGNTVVWGQGPYGELGLEGKRSSAKPAFVESLEGKIVSDLACGQGTTLYVIKDDKGLPRADLKAVDDALKK
jgi:alpha-tubulin suppressor-like RCC1 family protein